VLRNAGAAEIEPVLQRIDGQRSNPTIAQDARAAGAGGGTVTTQEIVAARLVVIVTTTLMGTSLADQEEVVNAACHDGDRLLM